MYVLFINGCTLSSLLDSLQMSDQAKPPSNGKQPKKEPKGDVTGRAAKKIMDNDLAQLVPKKKVKNDTDVFCCEHCNTKFDDKQKCQKHQLTCRQKIRSDSLGDNPFALLDDDVDA